MVYAYAARVRPRIAALLFLLACSLACTPAPALKPQEQAPAPSNEDLPPVHKLLTKTIPIATPETIQILALAPGLSASQVEHQVTSPIEMALASPTGIARIESTSQSGRATITLELDLGEDLYSARKTVLERLQEVRSSLPPDVDPMLAADRSTEPGRVIFALRIGDTNPTRVRDGLRQLRETLAQTAGVSEITLCGERREEVMITVDPKRLQAHAIRLSAIRDALVGLGLDTSQGSGLRVRASVGSLEDLNNLLLTTDGVAAPLRLGDLASISIREGAPHCDAAQLGGQAAILGVVHTRQRSDPAVVGAAIRGVLEQLAPDLAAHGLALELASKAPIRILLELSMPGSDARAYATALATAFKRDDLRAFLQTTGSDAPEALVDGELMLFDAPQSPATLHDIADNLAALPGVYVRELQAEGEPRLLRVRIRDDDFTRASNIADRIVSLSMSLETVVGARSMARFVPDVAIEIDREKIARLGMNLGETLENISLSLTGTEITQVAVADRRLPVRLRLATADPDPARRPDPEVIRSITLPTADGGTVQLGAVATIRIDSALQRIHHVDLQRSLDVEIRLAKADARESVRHMLTRELELPKGVTIAFE